MLTVFYGEQIYGTYERWSDLRDAILPDREIYNGCYVYMPNDGLLRFWYRGDTTPVLIEDVPKVLRTLVLLMG